MLKNMLSQYRIAWQADRHHHSNARSVLGRLLCQFRLFDHTTTVQRYMVQLDRRNKAKLDAFVCALKNHSELQATVQRQIKHELLTYRGKVKLRSCTMEATLRSVATELALQNLDVMPLATFDLAGSQGVGGVSGSKKVRQKVWENQGHVYHDVQLKNTNLDRIKVGSHDAPNYAELICGRLISVLLSPESQQRRGPKINQVYDPVKCTMLLGSRYLENVQDNLEQFARTQTGYQGKRRMVISLAAAPAQGPKSEHYWYLGDKPQFALLKNDLQAILAARAIIGDHDVNPGNMVVVKEENAYRLKPIDFGHGLNSLIRHSAIATGGGLQYPENGIVDYFFRSTVLHVLAEKRISKVRRFYDGLWQSDGIEQHLREMANKKEKVISEIGQLRKYFCNMLDALMLDPARNRQLISKSLHTLQVLAQRLGSQETFRPYGGNSREDVHRQVNVAFEQVEKFFNSQFQSLAALQTTTLSEEEMRITKAHSGRQIYI